MQQTTIVGAVITGAGPSARAHPIRVELRTDPNGRATGTVEQAGATAPLSADMAAVLQRLVALAVKGLGAAATDADPGPSQPARTGAAAPFGLAAD